MSRTPWADIKRRFEDPGYRLTNGLTGEFMVAGDVLHINDSHIPLWIVNECIWLDENANFVHPVPSLIHLPVEDCAQ